MTLDQLGLILLSIGWLGTLAALLADRRARARAWREIALARRDLARTAAPEGTALTRMHPFPHGPGGRR